MNGFHLQPEAPRRVDYAIASVAGGAVLLVTYLVGLVIAFAVAFRVTDPFVDGAADVRSTVLPLLGVAALLAGCAGGWLAARLVRRKHADARGVWILLAAIVSVVAVLAVPGLWAVPKSLAVQLIALVVGTVCGGLLALRRGPGSRR